MKYTKEELGEFKKDPLMNFLAELLGTSMDEVIKNAEIETAKMEPIEPKKQYEEPKTEVREDDDEIGKRIKSFFDKMVNEGKATATVENGQPHYSIKMDNEYKEPEPPEELIEDNGTSFSMSKEELEEFIKNYTKLENTFRKLEHTFGIDLNANGDSIYTQYNSIVWNLIEKIFGEDNREDIVDYCFGDSNFDTVEDLYEELV